MKGTKVIFAVCLALLGFGDVWATESDDAVRAAVRRGTTNTITSTRKKSNTTNTPTQKSDISRTTNATSKPTQTIRERAVSSRKQPQNDTSKTASARTSGNVSSRTTTVTRTPVTTATSRSAVASRGATRTPTIARNASTVRGGTQRTAIARNATDTTENLRDSILKSNARECRDIYYNCMDEFCANKDSQLKRCACSSRLHEFDNVKKQLAAVEDKMLDFSQRLLTVSMDAEDAAALNIATEGELAFNKKDTSASKKILDEIANKLNTKFTDDSFERNLTAISLSLDEDAAFDTVDSLMGASTTLKTGTELYGAALPICREMAAEVCTPEQLSIAESGYQMMIEQDCNTVKKSYQSQTDAARTKVFENSALLDISRLSTYQDKNSDDILTCKRKMLDMLSDTSICGTDLTRCLDMTGQYIDPLTGTAFLTQNLANLGRLITRPTDNQKWTNVPGNEIFVQYLDSKKNFLEPAMEHCQDISDMVWTDFIEDALAQIKLAQDAKLEQVRQSCTTLTTQCLSNASKSLADFDARALSIFGVLADSTVNAMCADVKNACTALMDATDDDENSWTTGMTTIATDATYETILNTCREVGRACIIQTCKSVSGNFGLCEKIETSVNRNAIIGRTACWNEVLACVESAGDDTINRIMDQLVDRNVISDKVSNEGSNAIPPYAFYKNLYGTTAYNICKPDGKCSDNGYTSTQCKACRIAERIWGNCEYSPNENRSSNKIKKPSNNNETTLLYWFALNTGTEQLPNSCQDTTCDKGFTYDSNFRKCIQNSAYTLDSGADICTNKRISVPGGENCCTTDKIDTWGNCCMNDMLYLPATNDNKHINAGYYNQELVHTDATLGVCVPKETTSAVHVATYTKTPATETTAATTEILICLGAISTNGTGTTVVNNEFPSGDTITCIGQYMTVDSDGMYHNPDTNDTKFVIENYYHPNIDEKCIYGTNAECWNELKEPTNWKVSFPTTNNTQQTESGN